MGTFDEDLEWAAGDDGEGVWRTWNGRQFRAIVKSVAKVVGDHRLESGPKELARSIMVHLVCQHGMRPAVFEAEATCSCDTAKGWNCRKDEGVCALHGRHRS